MSPSGRYLHVEELADPSDQYELGSRIAEGTYGEIYLAKDKQSGSQVVIKITENTEENFPDIEEEYRILKDLSVHPNIPKLYGVFRKIESNDIEQIWIAMEYCSGGSATDLIQKLKELGEAVKEDYIAYILYHTVQAVCHLHRNHVMHRDIKGQNILLTAAGDVKLVDFGISRHLRSTMGRHGTAIGTPYWMAPEVILCDQLPDGEYDIRADVWSLGVTAIELGDGVPPLADIHPVRAMFQITRNPPPTAARPADWSQQYLDFIAECLEKNPENRPLMEEVLGHPFLAEMEARLVEMRAQLAALLARVGPAATHQPAQVTSKAGYLRTRPHSKSMEILQDDLAALEDVTDDGVLNLLEKRFNRSFIYTFVADVLIAINPYSETGLFDAKAHEAFRSRARSDNPPHVFAVADRAHQDAAHHKRAQTIVFTGETGAGKTFNARMALHHLCHLGKGQSLSDKVKSAAFMVDLLGSAATSSSANATRQVRYLEVTFTRTGRLSGVIVWMYMLERWRVTNVRRNDGTFNALYAYFYGLQQSGRLGIYKLQKMDEYRFLPKHRHLDPADSAEKFKEFERALDTLEVSKDKQETIRKVVAAIILLGEVNFEETADGVAISNKNILDTVSFLLSVDEEKLAWAMRHRCRIVAGEPVKETKTAEQAAASRDALARLLYGRLVDSIVNWTNAAFTLNRLLFGEANSVGLLDMYGFESRSTNYLEQLLVNSFNEQMQSFYNQSVFQWEMEDLCKDDVEVAPYKFVDNSATIDMLMKKGQGLLALLDETTLSASASDDAFLDSCKENIESRHFMLEKDGFAIAHYAGKVSYSAQDIMAKNKDNLDAEVFDTLRQSENPFVAPMFLLPLTKTGNLTMDREQAQRDAGKKARVSDDGTGNKRFDTRSRGRLSQTGLALLTQASCYRFSAMEVMHKLINSTPHFVRCIRPNGDNAASTWDTGLVSHQLKCMQIVNTIAARRDGFSQRIDFAEFLRRYQFLAFDFDEKVEVSRENCRLLLVRLKMDGYVIGREKIFLKYFNEEFMSRLYEREVKKIAKVQAMVRAFLVRRRRRAGQPPDVTRLLATGGKDWRFEVHPQRGATGGRYRRRPSALSTVQEDATTRQAAAELIQRFYRRWRGKTIFQQLQLYRAAKHHQLIIFSHQVHIYGQEFFQYQARHKEPVPLEEIRAVEREAGRQSSAARLMMLRAVRKIPVSLSMDSFVDTAAMCEPHQPTPPAGRSHSGGRRRSSSDGERLRSVSPLLSPEPCPRCRGRGAASPVSGRASPVSAISHVSAQVSPFCGRSSRGAELARAGSPSPTFVFEPPPCPVPPVSETRAVFDRQTVPPPAYPVPTAPPYNRFAGSTYASVVASGSAGGGGFRNKRPPAAEAAPMPFVQELQERAGRSDDDASDEPRPFDFRSMLKKTNVTRESMKRREADVESAQAPAKLPPNVFISPYGKPTGYNAKKMRNKSVDDEGKVPALERAAKPQDGGENTETAADGGRRGTGAEPSQNGGPAPAGEEDEAPLSPPDPAGTVSPQIVFEGEEVDL